MFEGVFTAIVTPFSDNDSIDETALRTLVDRQIGSNINGIVPCGTTGESPTLSHEEHVKVMKIVVDQVGGRVPVITGCGSNCTREACDLTTKAKELGADASLQVAPYYNKPTQNGFFQHFTTIADTVDLPMIIYNIPGRTGKNIENSTMLKLASHKNIVGVKEASGDINQIMDLIQEKPRDFVVLSGDDNMTYPMMALGGKGVISVASNIVPGIMAEFIKHALSNNWDAARILHYKLLPLFRALFFETNPIPVKTGLAVKGLIQENFRLPMCTMQEDQKRKFLEVLRILEAT